MSDVRCKMSDVGEDHIKGNCLAANYQLQSNYRLDPL